MSEENKVISGETERAGRDMNTDISEQIGEKLAEHALNIPAVKKFVHAIRKVNGIDTGRAVRSFRRKILEGL